MLCMCRTLFAAHYQLARALGRDWLTIELQQDVYESASKDSKVEINTIPIMSK